MLICSDSNVAKYGCFFFFISFDIILNMKNDTWNMRGDAKSLGKLQGGLNMPCVKFYSPAPRFEGLIKKNLQISNQR